MLETELLVNFRSRPEVQELLPEIERSVLAGEITPTAAVRRLIEFCK